MFSKINVVNPDLKRFPQFRKARRHMVTLSPGQVMGTLKHWWPVSGHPSYNFFQVLCHVPPCQYRWLTVVPSLLLCYWVLASPAVGFIRSWRRRSWRHRSWKGNERRVHGSSWWWRGEWTVEEDPGAQSFLFRLREGVEAWVLERFWNIYSQLISVQLL